MKPSAWLALVVLLTPCLTRGQNSAPDTLGAPDKQGDYVKIVDHFFDKVKTGDFTGAAHVLIDSNPQDAFNVEKHEALADPLQKIQDSFGPFKEFKPLVVKTLGTEGVGYVYGLAIYQRDPIRFEFMFYKEGADWRLFHIDFNLYYVPEIRELAGVHIPAAPVYTTTSAPAAPAVKPRTPAAAPPSASPVTPSATPTPSAPATPSGPPATPPASVPAAAPSPVPSPTPHP